MQISVYFNFIGVINIFIERQSLRMDRPRITIDVLKPKEIASELEKTRVLMEKRLGNKVSIFFMLSL